MSPLAQAIITRTQQFVVMERPHYFYTSPMCHLPQDGRKLSMNIMQVHHIRAEGAQQRLKFPTDFIRTERPGASHPSFHFLWEKSFPRSIYILRIVHGKYGHFVSMLPQQPFRVEHASTIAATTIIEFIGKQDSHKNFRYEQYIFII